MGLKKLVFDCNKVSVEPKAGFYFTVKIKTEYLDEILENFSPEEIIKSYGKLSELYHALGDYFDSLNIDK